MTRIFKQFIFPFLPTGIILPMVIGSSCSSGDRIPKPNVIIFYIDDLGYSDLGCYGSKINRTPHVDKMAAEGMLFTDFYSASSVCTPSRAALLTGCYPIRVDMAINDWETGMKQVLFPVSKKGLNPKEFTIADMLKEQGYRTACIGKWHLGDQPDFLPTRQGFDYFFGIPYSNDMGSEQFPANPPLPLIKNETVIEAPVEQDNLTKRCTEEAISFIKEDPKRPFFLYIPHVMVHHPLHASEEFRGKSANGIYGDAVEEIDWSVGRLKQFLMESGLDKQTLVIFTSDNGGVPKLGGSNLPLAGSKGTLYEGGFRVPMIACWPGVIPSGTTTDALCSTMDFLPTLSELCGGSLPGNLTIDGKNIVNILYGRDNTSQYDAFYYYQKNQLQAVRAGHWKLILPLKEKILYPWSDETEHSEAKLFNLQEDIGEKLNLAGKHPEIVNRLTALAESARLDLGDFDKPGKNTREAGFVQVAEPMVLK